MVEPNNCPEWQKFNQWMETQAIPRTKEMFAHVVSCDICRAKIHESKEIQAFLERLNISEEDLLNILKGIASGGA